MDDTRLRGRWLVLARASWWILTCVTLTLLGAGALVRFSQIQTLCPTPTCNDGSLPPEALPTLRHLGLSYDGYLSLAASLRSLHLTFSIYMMTAMVWQLISGAVFVGVAAIIWQRRSDVRMALFTSLMLLVFGASLSEIVTALPREAAVWTVPVSIVSFLGAVSFVGFLLVFPNGRFVPRWTRWVALAWLILAIPSVSVPNSPLDLNMWWPVFNLAAETGVLGIGIWAQIHRYRRVDLPAQRVQTKWVVCSAVATIVTVLGLNWALIPFLPAAAPTLSMTILLLAVTTVVRVAFVLIPISIGIAIVRYRLFDIDRNSPPQAAVPQGACGLRRASLGFSHSSSCLPCIQPCDRMDTWRAHQRASGASQYASRWTY